MRKRVIASLTLGAALALVAAERKTEMPETLLGAAIHQEEGEGDLEAAIATYKKFLAGYGSNRPLAAKAQFHLGLCYEKLGKSEARKAYEGVLSHYADQQEIVDQARARLAALEPHMGANAGRAMSTRRVWAGADVDTTGSLSADGRFLSYVDWETGDLAIRNVETGENHHLTNKGSWSESNEFAEGSTPSPDGKQVAYWWYNKDDSYDLRVVGVSGEPGGAKPRVIYRNKEVKYFQLAGWSPDGKNILALFFKTDATNQIVLIAAADGAVRVLKTLGWRSSEKMSFSPDGRYIAYDFSPQEDSPQHDIFLLATDGSREIPIVEYPADDLLLDWTPDGKSILFSSDRTGTTDVWTVAVNGGKTQRLPELVKRELGRISPIGFSPRGAFYYAVETGIRDVYTVAIDSESLKPLAAPLLAAQRFLGRNQGADWSADGKYLVYASRHGHAESSPSVICIRSVETGEEREITPKLAWIGSYHGVRWSPTGQFIFVTGRDRKGRDGLYKVNAQTGETEALAYADPAGVVGMPTPSPDGNTIYYLRRDPTGLRIMARNLRPESERQVFRFPVGYFGHIALSPDGKRLAFIENTTAEFNPKTSSQVLMVIPTGGGEPRVLVRAPVLAGFAVLDWTPDGRQLLFAKPGEKKLELWRVSVETGEQHVVGAYPQAENVRAARISPDGRQIAYTAGQVKKEVWVLENFLPTLTAAK